MNLAFPFGKFGASRDVVRHEYEMAYGDIDEIELRSNNGARFRIHVSFVKLSPYSIIQFLRRSAIG